MTVPDQLTLPCGCRADCDVIDGVRTLVWTACADGLDCKWIAWAMREAEAVQGTAPTVIDAR